MNFDLLVDSISKTHSHFQQQAAKAVNVSLTLRNWIIGFYLVEFEQNGEDRAAYGTGLLNRLADQIKIKGWLPPNFPGAGSFTFVIHKFLGQ